MKKEKFLANGIAPDSKDLMIYSLMRGLEIISVSLGHGNTIEVIGNIPDVKVNTRLNGKTHPSAILVLEGEFHFENVSVSEGEILVLDGTEPMVGQVLNGLILSIYCRRKELLTIRFSLERGLS